MRRVHSAVIAAVIGCGGFAFAADPPTGTADTNATRTETRTEVRTQANTNTGAAVAAPDAEDIQESLAEVTGAAVTKGGFDNLVRRFVDADRDRLGKFKPGDNYAKLDGRIDQFNKDWKAKYGQDFGFENKKADVFNNQFARIVQGEIGEARTASGTQQPSGQPQNVQGGSAADLQKSGVTKPDAQANNTAGGNTNREPGRNVATVIVQGGVSDAKLQKAGDQATQGNLGNAAQAAAGSMQKELAVPMIHELPDAWKIDLPDNIDGQRLHDNLLKHITMFNEQKDNWPTDVNEGYRQAMRHVLMALTETGQGM